MTEREKPDEILEPGTIAQQAAALSRHLELSGVVFLPNPKEEGVNKWTSRMQPQAANVVAKESVEAPQPRPETTPAATPKRRVMPTLLGDQVEQTYAGDPLPAPQRTQQLQVLQQQVAECTRCPELVRCRTNTVFGEGSVTPRVAFFGEGPGADEDRTGRPFVGKAGQLLTKMIEACKMKREDVYIFNTVKCRPPGNRNPEPEEVSNCREYFEQQLQILRPEYIVCLGAVASQSLLKSKLSVGRLRGKFHPCFESKVLVTYHPAYLLRNKSAKKFAWQDLQFMLRDAGLM